MPFACGGVSVDLFNQTDVFICFQRAGELSCGVFCAFKLDESVFSFEREKKSACFDKWNTPFKQNSEFRYGSGTDDVEFFAVSEVGAELFRASVQDMDIFQTEFTCRMSDICSFLCSGVKRGDFDVRPCLLYTSPSPRDS